MVAYTVPDAGKAMLDRYGIVQSFDEADRRLARLTDEYREFLEQIGCASERVESEVARFVRLHG